MSSHDFYSCYHLLPTTRHIMEEFSGDRLNRLTGMLKRRGVLLPAFEIHGGVAGLYDYGPVGGRIRNKVNQSWLNHWLTLGNIVEISSPTITPYSVLDASGHVGEFSDYIIQCNDCEEASRADHLVENVYPNADSFSFEKLTKVISELKPICPACGSSSWGNIKSQNLMFSTTIGNGLSGRKAFLRPETAQGMFTSFTSIYRHFRERLPFGAMQVGKGYRNEISPRQGMIRLREFNMAELEYFIDPDVNYEHDFSIWEDKFTLISEDEGEIDLTLKDAVQTGIIKHPTVGYFMGMTFDFVKEIGINPIYIRFRQHESNEMAHYALDCWDLEVFGSFGWVECVGLAHRGCYDLEAHEKATGERLRSWRSFDEPKIVNIDGWTIDSSTVGPTFKSLAGDIKEEIEKLSAESTFPMDLVIDGNAVTIEEKHVKRIQVEQKISGEWFIPHVVEPAFGIDRLIWHALDHSYTETEKSGEDYTILSLPKAISSIDVTILPLFEKDGIDTLAKELHIALCKNKNLVANYDGSGSIGRRYARADEIGVPYCLTVDYDSLNDNTVTIRDRDTGDQKRVKIEDLEF